MMPVFNNLELDQGDLNVYRGKVFADKGFDGDVRGNLTPKGYAVEDLPDAEDCPGMIVYCSDGADGLPCLAISDGSDWLQIAIGLAVDDGGE
jgi:hypothetical protein